MTVAPSTPSTIGVSRFICFLVMTLSTRYFVEAGSTRPETRLMAISPKPSASRPRRGFINAQTSGRLFHAFLRVLSLEIGLSVVSVAMRRGEVGLPVWMQARPLQLYRRKRSEEHTSEL